jgi:hypothetical protein
MRSTALLVLLALLTFARPAAAWTEARPAGLVTELVVDRDGGATVTLRVRWRVLAGRFRAFDVAELPGDFTLLEATATDATGNPVAVSTRIPSAGRLEVTLGEDGGLRRGAIDVVVRYTTSLRAQGAIHRVGNDAVVEVVTVPWERGLEATEMRVALPASARRAQWLADETPGVDATVTSELGRDVVHAMRRHLPAGTRWTGRIACDPALFAWLDGPQVAPQVARRAEHRSLAPTVGLATLLALGLGGMANWLLRRRRGEGLVRLHPSLRLLPVALAAAGGAIQSLALLRVPGVVTTGALVALAGFALLAPRVRPLDAPEPSGPFRLWPDARALATADDGARIRGPWIAACVAVATGAVLAVAAAVTRNAWLGIGAIDLALVGMAAAVSFRRLLPARDALVLRGLARRLARLGGRDGATRVAWRVRGDGSRPGSVRLRLIPRPGYRLARGVHALECALAWQAGTLAWHPVAVLIVRVQTGSPMERSLRLAATRVGRIEVSPDGDQLALVAPLVGPDRRVALRELEALLPEALVRSPSPAARERVARDALATDGAAA